MPEPLPTLANLHPDKAAEATVILNPGRFRHVLSRSQMS